MTENKQQQMFQGETEWKPGTKVKQVTGIRITDEWIRTHLEKEKKKKVWQTFSVGRNRM